MNGPLALGLRTLELCKDFFLMQIKAKILVVGPVCGSFTVQVPINLNMKSNFKVLIERKLGNLVMQFGAVGGAGDS